MTTATAPYSRILVPKLSIPWMSLWSVCCCLPPLVVNWCYFFGGSFIPQFPVSSRKIRAKNHLYSSGWWCPWVRGVSVTCSEGWCGSPVLCLVRISCCLWFFPGYVHLYGKLDIYFHCWQTCSKAVRADKPFKSTCFKTSLKVWLWKFSPWKHSCLKLGDWFKHSS